MGVGLRTRVRMARGMRNREGLRRGRTKDDVADGRRDEKRQGVNQRMSVRMAGYERDEAEDVIGDDSLDEGID